MIWMYFLHNLYNMISELKGTVVDMDITHVVIDVAGVGYTIETTSTSGFQENEEVRIFTYLAVQERALDLYGFSTKEEREIFKLLLKLPKIGPKSAMQILTKADIELLKKAVAQQDPVYLTKMSGLGKKTSEKVVDGLKDAFEKAGYEDTSSPQMSGDSDVVDALMTLGYTQKDARDALANISPEVTDTNERIKEALKTMAG